LDKANESGIRKIIDNMIAGRGKGRELAVHL
jgi:hypothetical protein